MALRGPFQAMAVKTVTILLCAAITVLATEAAEDHALCKHRWSSETFYSTPGSTVISINVRGVGKQSDLVVQTVDKELKLARANKAGIFKDSMSKKISDASFCSQVGDRLRSGDIDGDSRDDLVCHKSDASFSVRHWGVMRYSDEKPFAAGLTCTLPLKLSDFDGNGADDLFCLDRSNGEVGGSWIYLNTKCSSYRSHDNHHSWSHREDDKHHRNLRYHSRGKCNPATPVTLTLPDATASLCVLYSVFVMFPGDFDNDGRDDIACLMPDHNIHVYLSQVTSQSAAFSTNPITTSGVCSFPDSLFYPMDLDGDGDDDIACVSLAIPTGMVPTVAYSTGTALTSISDPGCATGVPFCVHGVNGYFTNYFVGDFNGDGKEDLMCRYENPTGTAVVTEIVYSEKIV